MQEEKKVKLKIQSLQEKLKESRASIRYLRQRNKDLEASRSKWKEKSKNHLGRLRLSEKMLWDEKRKSKELLKEKVKGYKYSSLLICLAIWLRSYCNCSLRSCVKVLEVLTQLLGLDSKIPSHSSIYNWECKLGYYRIEKKEVAKGKWSLIIDESISIAQQRILLLLGCRLDGYKFDRPINFKDIEVLSIGVDKSWTELCIGQRIREVQSKGYEFVSSVSDGGKAIVKALRVNKMNRVADCTHAFGNLLERQYKKADLFKGFSKLCGELKTQLMNGSSAYLIPPKQRVKGRFLNLFELGKWGTNMIKTIESDIKHSLSDVTKKKLDQLLEYKELIHQVDEQCQTIKQLFKVLKTQGLSTRSEEQCQTILLKSQANEFFKKGVKEYLKVNLKQDQPLICTSDIIESIFGKYKNRMAKNKMAGFGLSCLTLANMTQDLTLAETKTAMLKVRMNDLKLWKKENLYPNPLERRKEWIKKCKKKLL